MMKNVLNYLIIFFLAICGAGYANEDPWFQLQEKFHARDIESVSKPVSPASSESIPEPVSGQVSDLILDDDDPWKKLRAVFLPFSAEEEKQAPVDPLAAKTMAQKISLRLNQYEVHIEKAAQIFDIPQAIIQAVIMAESGGDSLAKAGTTSAKGLMQTIDSTFKMAKKALEKQGIYIPDTPFDPGASIMAGSWYLDRMYKKALTDQKMKIAARQDISSWRYPLEYYYAGPGNGAKPKNKIFVFSNGTKRIIDKRAYSKKIQTWAKILEEK
ncbi:lytic transglycosylase domain-containing protein [Desulfobacula phenolica]|uniref:Transglycosylase SLT domain-containing protein n=1 Tax=Desulfobacula phenolica TaxID=90732 RepID=A0A1H2JKQ3_9BACT|nr:transglycosylase SLT domain-containing protein [Desulfobacula phenolica]SDU57030.1 Transglycosylase SLT domain-containing protein [Desulfobacula phenolica]